MANHGIAITSTNDVGTVTSNTTATAGTATVSPTQKAFFSFDTSAVTDTDDVVTSRISLTRASSPGGNIFDLEAYACAWSPGPVTASDGLLSRGNFWGQIINVDSVSSFSFETYLSSTSTSVTGRTDVRLEYVQRSGQPTAGSVTFNGAGAATTSKPMIRVRTAPTHVLRGCGGSHCQLSTGQHVFVSMSGTTLSLVNVPAAGASGSAVLTITSLFGYDPAYETFSITRDASDNLYIIGPAPASLGNGFVIRKFNKTGSNTFADSGLYRFQALSTSQRVTGTSIQWFNPNNGVTTSRLEGHVRCTPSGGGSFGTDGSLTGALTYGPMPQYPSDCGTLLDTTKATANSTVVQHLFQTVLSDSSAGALMMNGKTADFAFTDSANIKARIFAISDTESVAIYPFATTTYDSGTNTETLTGGGWRAAYLAAGMTTPIIRTLTTATNLNVADSVTFKWDAAWDPNAQSVNLYYLDSGTPTTVRKTQFYLVTQDWTGVSVSLGLSTAVSSCINLMTPRGYLATTSVMIQTASASSSIIKYDTLTAAATPATSAPATPTFTTTTGDGFIQLAITNPTVVGNATPSYNDVYRRKAGENLYSKVKRELTPNTSWKDYGVESGVVYEYYVEAVAF